MNQSWIDQIAQASPPFQILAVLLCLGGLYLGFSHLHRFRLIEDVPTAKIRSAHQGYVELVGQAVMMPGIPIIAPLTQTPCCWYRYQVEERRSKTWHRTESVVSDGLFVLRDDTGDCVIDPDGALIDTVHRQQWSGDDYGVLSTPRHQPTADRVSHRKVGFLRDLIGSVQLETGHYRFQEQVILEGDPLYAIGWFHSVDDSARAQNEALLTRQTLSEWKKQPEVLQRRFDRNHDGQIDLDEWDVARQAARSEVQQQLAQHVDNGPVHTLIKPQRQPFLVSNRHQDVLVQRHKWLAAMGFTGFFIGGAAATLMISTQYL